MPKLRWTGFLSDTPGFHLSMLSALEPLPGEAALIANSTTTGRMLRLDLTESGLARVVDLSITRVGGRAAAPEEALFRMGTGLAALHGTGLSLPNRWDPARELESMHHCARLLAEERLALAGTAALGHTVEVLVGEQALGQRRERDAAGTLGL